ncbi:MAG: GIY-YIG nuclease family protein [Hyphomicrobiales bacterium]
MERGAFLYIMTNRRNGTLYVGAATNLAKRIWEHRQGIGSRFTSTYGLKHLVYVEPHSTIQDAVARERLVKKWRRAWKIRLIEDHNPDWRDLFEDLFR